jgi:uncharacterized protein YecE (DUF72 family)
VALWIGTSGWQYEHWRGRLYPRDLPTDRWLDRYVEVFETVELNVTFYRQPRPAVFEGWARRVPDRFRFAVKASRFLTHVKRLREPGDSVKRLLDGALRLGPHLGPVLLQLPPDMGIEAERLEETLAAFPASVRVAVEPRNASWFVPAVRELLQARNAALCLADRRGPLQDLERTADWGYLRFHGGRARPRPCYGDEALRTWAHDVRATWSPDADVFAYFNNDHAGCAPRDAGIFGGLSRGEGLRPTRVPEEDATPVGPAGGRPL